MNVDVTIRLQEQSELIMVLKSRADSEIERRKEAEHKLLDELSKSQYLHQQLLDCQRRVCDAEVNNRVLRSTIKDLSHELLSQTLVKNPNTVISTADVSIQTEIETHQNEITSVKHKKEEILKTHLLKIRELHKETNELSQLANETKSVYVQHRKTIQDNLKTLTDLVLTVCNSYLQINHAYCNNNIERKNEEQCLLLQLENERHLNEAIRTKLNIVENDKIELENTTIKLKKQKDREIKELNANKQVKRLKEELANSYLHLEQIKQDFEAYKIYAKELLHNEKMLNKELRQSYH
ncbi:hypothetical protein MN116_005163 [Schistosoma mekongi]|uniref:Uncharacterized protein n=1 Tax=Schistosoma mekongi TaxID=38744 RepID=A0AAE1ZD82_SCHME|nr:hypothetical protein MN116_005163 [Schistosoma mekongi]